MHFFRKRTVEVTPSLSHSRARVRRTITDITDVQYTIRAPLPSAEWVLQT